VTTSAAALAAPSIPILIARLGFITPLLALMATEGRHYTEVLPRTRRGGPLDFAA
jgi:hypothetical protein